MLRKAFDHYINIIKSALNIENDLIKYSDTIIINEKGQFLILLRSNSDEFQPGKWTLPGGKVDPGENFFEAAIREVSEETNIQLSIADISQYKTVQKENCLIHYHIASVQLDDLKIILDNEEHQGYEWISPEEIVNYDFLLDLKDFLLLSFNIQIENFYEDEIADDVEILSLSDKITKSEQTLHLALNEGLDDDVYLDKLQKLQFIKSNFEKSLVERESYSGNKFKVRIRKNVIVKSETEDNSIEELDFENKYNDYINDSFYYKGRIYDKNGLGLPLDSTQISKILSSYSAIYVVDDKIDSFKSNKEIFPEIDRYKFEEVLPIIEKYNELYDEYENDVKELYNSVQNNFKSRRKAIKRYIKDFFNKRVNNLELNDLVQYLQDNFNSNLDPLLILKFKNRSNQIYLSELEDYLKEINPKGYLGIQNIEIVDLDNYGDMEFLMDYFNPNDSLIISSIHEKVKSKLKNKIDFRNNLKKSFENNEFDEDFYIEGLIKGEKWVSDAMNEKEKQKKLNLSEQQLKEHAKNTSLVDLELIIKESNDPTLREIAHKEIKRREDKEHIQEKEKKIKKSEDIEILDNIKPEILKGCLMLYPEIDSEKWKSSIENLISKDIVQEYEYEPHITILYGFDDEKIDLDKLKKVVNDYLEENNLYFDINPISIFSNENDVVKIGINDLNGNLYELNELIRENFEYQNNFPDYQPHMTLAYVNKGEGEKFVGQLIDKSQFGMGDFGNYSLLYSNSEKFKTRIDNRNSAELPVLQKARGQITPIGQLDKSGKHIKTADGWERIKSDNIINKRKYLTNLTKEDGYSDQDLDLYYKDLLLDDKIKNTTFEFNSSLKGQSLVSEVANYISENNLRPEDFKSGSTNDIKLNGKFVQFHYGIEFGEDEDGDITTKNYLTGFTASTIKHNE